MMRANPIKVLSVDDNELVGEVIRITLKRAGGFEWLGHLSDAQDLVAKAREHCPDIVLLDIFMPGKDPFVAMHELNEVCPDARVIMYSAYVSPRLIERALDAGAWGYVSKDDEGDALLSAIERVAEGEFVMGPKVRAGSGI